MQAQSQAEKARNVTAAGHGRGAETGKTKRLEGTICERGACEKDGVGGFNHRERGPTTHSKSHTLGYCVRGFAQSRGKRIENFAGSAGMGHSDCAGL